MPVEPVSWVIAGCVVTGAAVTIGSVAYTFGAWFKRKWREFWNTCYPYEQNQVSFHALTLAFQDVFDSKHGIYSARTLETRVGQTADGKVRNLILPTAGTSLTVTHPKDQKAYFWVYVHDKQLEVVVPPRRNCQELFWEYYEAAHTAMGSTEQDVARWKAHVVSADAATK